MIETARLRLVPYSPQMLIALIEGDAGFEERFGMRVAEGLRTFYRSGDVSPAWLEALRAASSAPADVWRHGLAAVLREAGVIIGGVGFKGPPDADGVVEVAYGIAPEFQGVGYATEAVAAAVAYVFATEPVRRVVAHALPTGQASMRVLTKCGFEHVGEVVDPGDGRVWRWERGRQ